MVAFDTQSYSVGWY